jgi:hypothetical protein
MTETDAEKWLNSHDIPGNVYQEDSTRVYMLLKKYPSLVRDFDNHLIKNIESSIENERILREKRIAKKSMIKTNTVILTDKQDSNKTMTYLPATNQNAEIQKALESIDGKVSFLYAIQIVGLILMGGSLIATLIVYSK